MSKLIHTFVVLARCVGRAQTADSERANAMARLRRAVDESAELKGRLKYTDALRVSRIGWLMSWWVSW